MLYILRWADFDPKSHRSLLKSKARSTCLIPLKHRYLLSLSNLIPSPPTCSHSLTPHHPSHLSSIIWPKFSLLHSSSSISSLPLHCLYAPPPSISHPSFPLHNVSFSRPLYCLLSTCCLYPEALGSQVCWLGKRGPWAESSWWRHPYCAEPVC